MRALLLLYLAVAGVCSADEVTVGSAAPTITLTDVLHAPEGTRVGWEALRGNVVVLEFWATWCPGCREQIAHVNALQGQFRDKPVPFLSITNEDRTLVERFVKEYPISGWIGLDSDEATFRRFGIVGLPVSVVVDAFGIVRYAGGAGELNAELIDAVLVGRSVSGEQRTSAPKLQTVPDPVYEMMIRRAGSTAATGFSPGATSGRRGKRWQTWGVDLRRLLSDAYEFPESRVEAPVWSLRFDVAIAHPDLTEARRRELLRDLLARAFDVKLRRVSRISDVYVLRRIDAAEPKLKPPTTDEMSMRAAKQFATAKGMSMQEFALIAERALGMPVVDKTALAGRFDFDMWLVGRGSFVEMVRRELGLELVRGRDQVEYLMVEAADEPTGFD